MTRTHEQLRQSIIDRVANGSNHKNPTLTERIEGHQALINHKVEVLAGQIMEILKERGIESKKQLRRFIDTSNTINGGEIDFLGKAHKLMNRRPRYTPDGMRIPDDLDKLIEWEIAEQKKRHRPKAKKGYGKFKNLTRNQLAELNSTKRASLNIINQKFEDASIDDPKNR